ncbi:MAG: hypothetical protein Q4B42_04000 [Oscillospiraceae bacterium]|nr:hypothetical protein [Oscillospiraceae bacterium]
MKNWKDECNFRRCVGEDGIERFYIIVDKQLVETNCEIYEVYSKSIRRERYVGAEQSQGRVLSLEAMAEDEMKLEHVCFEVIESGEEVLLNHLEQKEHMQLLCCLRRAIRRLSDDDRELIEALYFKGVGVREYARQKGVFDRAIRKRRDKILREIKVFLEKSGF